LPPAVPAGEHNHTNRKLGVANHEYFIGKFSGRYFMSQRVRSWDKPSYTIIATANGTPIHPAAPMMVKRGRMDFIFAPSNEHKYRRLSVRECARIQTFPDDFIFHYKNVVNGYKMVGNAVPPQLAKILAEQIAKTIFY
jgi:DNA (cytosine-5)-methyltransferase 1